MALYHPTKLPFEPDLLDRTKEVLQSAKKVVIIAHRGPDGDAIGSNLALKNALEQWGVEAVSACIDPPPEYALFLKGSYSFVNDFDLNEFDVVIAVDCGSYQLMQFHETKPLLKGDKPFINIDHHPSNEYFGTHNLVNENAAATAFTMTHLLKYWGFTISRDIATALLMGLYYDTGSFMHSNTSRDVLETSAELMNKGADFKRIVKLMFRTTPVNQLKLWGRVMSRARLNSKQAVVAAVTQDDFRECDASHNDLSGVIDFLNSVPESKFSILLSEHEDGQIKGSLRTQEDDINVSEIAALFGGGGHKKAAGFSLPGKLRAETHWKITDK